jgi:hypothetical protein
MAAPCRLAASLLGAGATPFCVHVAQPDRDVASTDSRQTSLDAASTILHRPRSYCWIAIDGSKGYYALSQVVRNVRSFAVDETLPLRHGAPAERRRL